MMPKNLCHTNCFMIFLVFLIVYRITSGTQISSHIDISSDGNSPPLLSSPNILNRSRRANDFEFDSTVKNLEMISRITNAIYIQQSLINGTIPTDVLISELLNFGSLTSSDLDAVDGRKIDEMIEKIVRLRLSLIYTSGVQRIEKRLLLYWSMLEKSEKFEKNQTIPEMAGYFRELKAFKNKNIVMDDINANVVELRGVRESLNKLRHWSTKLPEAIKELRKIEGHLKKINLSKVAPYSQSLKNEKLRMGTEIFMPLSSVIAGIDQFSRNRNLVRVNETEDQHPVENTVENMKKLKLVADEAKASLPIFQALCEVFVTSQHRRGNKNLFHTSGFFHGYSDLVLLFSDLNDEWTRSAVYEQFGELAESFVQLKTIHSRSHKIHQLLQLKAMDYQFVSNKCDDIAKLAEVADLISPLDKQVAKMVINAEIDDLMPATMGSVDSLIRRIRSLEKTLKEFDNVIALSERFQQNKTIAKMLDIVSKANTDAEVESAWKQMKENPDVTDAYNKMYALRWTQMWDLHGMENDFKNIEPFISSLQKTYFPKIKVFRDMEGFKSVEKVISAIKKFGQSQETGSMENALKTFATVEKKVSNLKTFLDQIKKYESFETNVLISQKSVSQEAKNIGSATRGISSMKSLMDLDPAKLNTLKTDAQLVATAKAGGYSGAELDEADKQNLDEFLKLSSSLDDVIKDINAFKTSFIGPAPSNITTQTEIFKAASGINGLPSDFLAISGSLEKLEGQGQNFKESVKILKILDTIGIDFASRQVPIQELKKSLMNMDQFFAQFNTTFIEMDSWAVQPKEEKPIQMVWTPKTMLVERPFYLEHLVICILIVSIIITCIVMIPVWCFRECTGMEEPFF